MIGKTAQKYIQNLNIRNSIGDNRDANKSLGITQNKKPNNKQQDFKSKARLMFQLYGDDVLEMVARSVSAATHK